MLHSEAQDLHLVWDSWNKMITYIIVNITTKYKISSNIHV